MLPSESELPARSGQDGRQTISAELLNLVRLGRALRGNALQNRVQEADVSIDYRRVGLGDRFFN
jgi:hypothetical protein